VKYVAAAIAFLAAVSAVAADRQPSVKRVWAGDNANLLGGPSPNGTLLSFADTRTGDLALLDIATGQARRVTQNGPESGQFAYFSAISRDGKRIAYAWFNEEKFYELRVVGIDGGEPVTLFRNEEAGFIQPCAWSADGKQILTLLFRKDNISQIALVDSTTPGKFRVMKSLNWVYPNKMDLSPDGRLVVYDNPAADDATQRDLFLLAVDGSKETRLLSGPANDIFPAWTNDGKSVVFVSDRRGSTGIWQQRVDGGAASGEPVLLKADAGRVLALGMARGNRFFYGLRTGSSDVKVAGIDLAGGRLSEEAKPAATGLEGLTSAPAWSTDGKKLAFLVRLANENFGQESRGIGIVSSGAEGGKLDKMLTPRLAHIEKLQWSHDGDSLLASGSDRQNRRGLYRVDATTGDVTPIVQHRSTTYRGLEGVWLAGGQSVIYAYPSEGGDELREQNPVPSNETTIYRVEPGARVLHLALSPGGRWLAFTVSGGKLGSREEVRVLQLKNAEARTIASVPQTGGVLGLEWTPDSEAVLISTPGDPAAALWRATLDGEKPQRLTARIERRDSIRIHPSGRRVAYTTGSTGSEVWVMELGDNK
jgi:Tol biopolymer transport system component